MSGKLNIPTPTPAKFPFKVFEAAPVAYTPSFPKEADVKFPTPYNPEFNGVNENLGLLIGGISAAEQLIATFLSRTPATQLRIQEPEYKIPTAAENAMQSVGGSTLGGTDLLCDIEFEGANYTAFSGQTKGFSSLRFNTVLMNVRQHKNMVLTNIQGSEEGDNFEYSGMASYDITINIIVVADNQNGIYPQSKGKNENGVEDIVPMLESPVSIKVYNWYLQMLNIHEIVILDYEIGQSEGGISQQPITIIAKSNKRSSLVVQSVTANPATNS